MLTQGQPAGPTVTFSVPVKSSPVTLESSVTKHSRLCARPALGSQSSPVGRGCSREGDRNHIQGLESRWLEAYEAPAVMPPVASALGASCPGPSLPTRQMSCTQGWGDGKVSAPAHPTKWPRHRAYSADAHCSRFWRLGIPDPGPGQSGSWRALFWSCRQLPSCGSSQGRGRVRGEERGGGEDTSSEGANPTAPHSPPKHPQGPLLMLPP